MMRRETGNEYEKKTKMASHGDETEDPGDRVGRSGNDP